jgi:hypothetical protein
MRGGRVRSARRGRSPPPPGHFPLVVFASWRGRTTVQFCVCGVVALNWTSELVALWPTGEEAKHMHAGRPLESGMLAGRPAGERRSPWLLSTTRPSIHTRIHRSACRRPAVAPRFGGPPTWRTWGLAWIWMDASPCVCTAAPNLIALARGFAFVLASLLLAAATTCICHSCCLASQN